MFNPEKYHKRPTDITKPVQHFDNFFGGGYHSSPKALHMPRHDIANNPYLIQIEQLNKQLRDKDDEISKLRVKNEMLEEQLYHAQEKLAKGQLLKTQAPFGFASPHPPYGIDV